MYGSRSGIDEVSGEKENLRTLLPEWSSSGALAKVLGGGQHAQFAEFWATLDLCLDVRIAS